MSGRPIDFHSLSPDELTKFSEVVRTIASYQIEKKQFDESIKETMDDFVSDLGADKESASKAKSIIRKAASIYAKNKSEEASAEMSAIDLILARLEEVPPGQ